MAPLLTPGWYNFTRQEDIVAQIAKHCDIVDVSKLNCFFGTYCFHFQVGGDFF
jgi:hypothetical protein